MRVFVDTNLLLDVLAKREPFYAAAARIWTLAETGACEALVSAISFNNVFLLTRNVGDFPAGILPILAPDEFLALLDHPVDGT
jgi:predicted nucleic acid-binding protein